MVLQDYKIDGEYICISKKELEEWREHYTNEAETRGRGKIGWFYLGKREAIIDILKMFEPLMGQSMKVKELIEKLQAIEDKELEVRHYKAAFYYPIEDVEVSTYVYGGEKVEFVNIY